MLARFNRRYVPAYWDDFFNDTFHNNFNHVAFKGSSPAVNVIEDDKEYRIDVAVPGLNKKDFRIDLENEILTISSDNKENKEEKKHNYMRREFLYNGFKRSFQLPETIDQENIKAHHEAGILTISLPKKDEVVQNVAKQIKIS
jgi:HSP20 family protein